jgi:dihydropteroate synthase
LRKKRLPALRRRPPPAHHILGNARLPNVDAELEQFAMDTGRDVILMTPLDDQSKLMSDILANLGSFVLEKKEEADPNNPRRPSHH